MRAIRLDDPSLDKLDLVAHARAVAAGSVSMIAAARATMVREVGTDYSDDKSLCQAYVAKKVRP